MHTVEDDALVLRIYSFAETDAIVVLLTRQHGKVRLMAKGFKKIRSRFQGIVSPFNVVSAQFKPGQGDRLGILSGASLRFGVDISGGSLDDYYFLSCMIESVLAIEIDPSTGETVFRLVDALVRLTARAGFHRLMLWYFLFWMIRLEGELADPVTCESCGRPFQNHRSAAELDPKTLAFRCRACVTSAYQGSASTKYAAVQTIFQRFLTSAPDRLIDAAPLPDSFDEIARTLADKLAQIIGKKLHSLNPLLASTLQRPGPEI